MRIPPIEVIASWPEPNYINPESRAPAGRIIGSIFLVLVTIVLAIRVYSRKQLTKGCGLDDIFICLAYLPATAFTISGIITQEDYQWSRHIWDVEPKFLSLNIIITLVHLVLFDLATSLTKLSMLAMTRRLTAAANNKLENVVVLALAVLITSNCFIFVMVEIFQCRPISSTWDLQTTSHNCINEDVHLMVANIINTATDFAVVLLPIRTAMRVRVSPRQRAIVASLFGIGLIGSVAGIGRTYFTWLLIDAGDYDRTWRAWPVWLSSLVELHLAIVSSSSISLITTKKGFKLEISQTDLCHEICASIPATKPFFTNIMKKRETPPALSSPFPPQSLPYPKQESSMQKPLPPITEKNTSIRGYSVSFADSSNTTDSPRQSRHVHVLHGSQGIVIERDYT
ncbi:hypothetical protein F5Y12DRAFT_720815 [Xylaria sp. FL1777]|nr:hypothetical protein F5Y12DRAFT_720815 [Xylaria sp. FL1777]